MFIFATTREHATRTRSDFCNCNWLVSDCLLIGSAIHVRRRRQRQFSVRQRMSVRRKITMEKVLPGSRVTIVPDFALQPCAFKTAKRAALEPVPMFQQFLQRLRLLNRSTLRVLSSGVVVLLCVSSFFLFPFFSLFFFFFPPFSPYFFFAPQLDVR